MIGIDWQLKAGELRSLLCREVGLGERVRLGKAMRLGEEQQLAAGLLRSFGTEVHVVVPLKVHEPVVRAEKAADLVELVWMVARRARDHDLEPLAWEDLLLRPGSNTVKCESPMRFEGDDHGESHGRKDRFRRSRPGSRSRTLLLRIDAPGRSLVHPGLGIRAFCETSCDRPRGHHHATHYPEPCSLLGESALPRGGLIVPRGLPTNGRDVVKSERRKNTGRTRCSARVGGPPPFSEISPDEVGVGPGQPASSEVGSRASGRTARAISRA